MKLKDLRIGTKLSFGFGIIVILTVALGIAALVGLNRVHDKSENLVRIRDIQKGFTEARLYLRTFSALKDTQFYVRSQNSMTKVIGVLDSLKQNLSGEEYTEMTLDLEKGLKDYAALAILNKKMILTQFEIVNELNEKAGQFKSEINSSGIQQTSLANFYFIQSLEHIRSIELNPSEENYQEAKISLEMSLKEVTRTKNEVLVSIINVYLSEINRFMEAAKANKEIDPQQLAAGKKALDSADRLGRLIDGNVDQTKKATTFFLIVFALISLVLGAAISIFITRYITVMLKRGVHLAETYASGELTFQVPAEDLAVKDEIGDLARAMVSMGDKIKEVVTTISQEAAIVSTASAQISSTTMQLSESSNEQASSIEEVSSSMEQMASNIMQNTENAGIAENITSLSAQLIREVANATQNSLVSARKITGKIGIINEIAFQTNILALNAAVEAARAGEQGKGFAVVASEVRKLAEHSKNAAGEIIELTQASLKATEEAEALVMKVLPDIEKSAMLIKEIASASIEQNAGADQVNNAVQQLNQVTQENASSAEELASSAEELAQEAEKLRAVTSYFKVETSDKKGSKKLLMKTHDKEKQLMTPGKRPAFPEKSGRGVIINLENNTNDSQYEKF